MNGYKRCGILGWPKSSFGFFHRTLQKSPNELFGQMNTMEYYSAIKKNEIMLFAATWMDLESLIY